MSLKTRILGTIGVVGLYGFVATLLNSTSTLVTGEVAVKQLDNSDLSFIASQQVLNHFNNLEGYLPLVAVILLIAIWWKPVKNLISGEINHEV